MSDTIEQLQQFKRRDAASYDEVTDPFDRYTERFNGNIAARLVERAALAPGECVLDVGSGTGVVTFKAAAAVGPGGRVVGIDLSDGMLAKARAKAARRAGGAGIEFVKGDAEALQFADASFDCVVSLFALRHFPHPDVALAQMRRVLKPGGRAIVAVGSGPQLLSADGLRAAWRRIGEALGFAASRKDLVACRYIDELVERHLPPGTAGEEAEWTHHHAAHSPVPGMLVAAGFGDVRATWAGSEGVVDSVDEFWELQATFSSLARKRLESASPDALARLRAEFDAGCAGAKAAGGRLRYPTGALIVSGTKGQ